MQFTLKYAKIGIMMTKWGCFWKTSSLTPFLLKESRSDNTSFTHEATGTLRSIKPIPVRRHDATYTFVMNVNHAIM